MLVMPSNVGRNESSTRAALLARRTEWLVTGLREEDMPDSMVGQWGRQAGWGEEGRRGQCCCRCSLQPVVL
jgi:hypothetical protein